MTPDDLHPLAEDYLGRLRAAGRRLPPERLRELVAELEGHLREAIPAGASAPQVDDVLARLGPPEEIVEAEQPAAPAGRRGRREWATLILLPLGGFALGVGWLVGLVLLWSSRLWTTREKLIGTLIVPGGIATALLVLVLTGTKRRCTEFVRGFVRTDPSTGAILRHASLSCTPSARVSAATTAWHIAVIAFCVLAPIVSAVYLARRARAGSTFAPGPRL
jgi:hypothetical protein